MRFLVFLSGFLPGLLLAASFLAAPAAWAWDTNARVYATSPDPFWKVGNRDTALSKLCQLGQFNQKRIAQVFIQFHGEKGRGIVGIAKKDFNLIDLTAKAQEGKTYHFYADGTSQCQVFVAP